MVEAEVAKPKRKPGWRTLARSLRNRKSAFMLLFGFASGLPTALVLVTHDSWLSEAELADPKKKPGWGTLLR